MDLIVPLHSGQTADQFLQHGRGVVNAEGHRHVLTQGLHGTLDSHRLLNIGGHQDQLGACVENTAQLQRHVSRLGLHIDHFHQTDLAGVGLCIGVHALA